MTTYPCPACLTEANLETGCPNCARPPDPLAAEVIELDGEIAELGGEVQRAREAYGRLSAQLQAAQRRRSQLAAQVWAAAHVPQAPSTQTAPTQARPEASTQTVKNVLFVLGGLLVGIAAVAFTALAWGSFDIGGKAVILAFVTALALAVPLVASRRGLRGTAETFAAIGLVLVVLDGYSVWRVNLGGVHDALSGSTYSGLVAALAAAISVAYARLTGLAGPAVIGLVAAQPVLPLLFANLIGDRPAGYALTFCAVAAADMLVAATRNRAGVVRPAAVFEVIAWIGYALGLAAAHVFALIPLSTARSGPQLILPATVLLLTSALGVAAGALARLREMLTAAVAWSVLLVVLIGFRFAQELAPGYLLFWSAVLVAAIALIVGSLDQRVSAAWWGGVIGVSAAGGVAALFAAGGALRIGALSVADALPWWRADQPAPPEGYDWRVPVALALLAGAGIALSARRGPQLAVTIGVAGCTLAALAAPGAPPLMAGFAPAVDLVAVGLLAGALVWRSRPAPVRITLGSGAAILACHAILSALGRPSTTALTLATLVLLAACVAAAGRSRDHVTGRSAVAICSPALVLLAAATARSLDAADPVVLHAAALTAAALPAGAWALRRVAEYAKVAEVSAVTTVVLTVYVAVLAVPSDGWTKSLYVAGGLLALALLAYVPLGERRLGIGQIAGWAALAVALAFARPPLEAFVASYRWLAEGWSAAPAGVGLTPAAPVVVTGGDVAAFALLTIAVGIDWYARTRNLRAALGAAATLAPVPVVLGLVAAGVRWPGVPLVMLVAGLARLVRTALRDRLRAVDAVVIGYAAMIGGSGLAGLTATAWSTILGLALVTVAFVVIGVRAGLEWTRWIAWPLAGVAWAGLAASGARAGELNQRGVEFVMLAAAGALLAAGVLLPRVAGLSAARALEPLAHLIALGTLGVAYSGGMAYGGSTHMAVRAAEVYLLWGVAVGLTALARARSARPAEWLTRLAAAGVLETLAWWSLLRAEGVQTIEAYSLPVAAVALAVGLLALRRDPALTSWIGYVPALLAAFGPSIAGILAGEDDPVRRLAVGVGALGVVIGGSVRRRQAPVVVGGIVLIVLALHELTLVWSRLPLWLPIGVGGAILLGLAITYERRLRDLRALRSTLGTFT